MGKLVKGEGAKTAPTTACSILFKTSGLPKTWCSPDIEQKITALSTSQGRDLQLEKAVEEALKLLEKEPMPEVKVPPYSTPGKGGIKDLPQRKRGVFHRERKAQLRFSLCFLLCVLCG